MPFGTKVAPRHCLGKPEHRETLTGEDGLRHEERVCPDDISDLWIQPCIELLLGLSIDELVNSPFLSKPARVSSELISLVISGTLRTPEGELSQCWLF